MGETVSLCLVRSIDRRGKHQRRSIETLWGLGKDAAEYATGEATGEVTGATYGNRGQQSPMETKFIVHPAILTKPLLKFYRWIENST